MKSPVSGVEELLLAIEEETEGSPSPKRTGGMLWRAFVAYGIPLCAVLIAFPWQSVHTLYLYHSPQIATLEEDTITWKRGFEDAQPIRRSERPPFLSALGISKEIFGQQFCVTQENYYSVGDQNVPVNFDALNIEITRQSGQKLTVPPNTSLCLPFDDEISYRIGQEPIQNADAAAGFMRGNNLTTMEGETIVSFSEELVFSQWIILLVLMLTVYPAWWTLMILGRAAHRFVIGGSPH